MNGPRQKDFRKFYLIGDYEWDLKFCRKIEDGTSASDTMGLCDPSIKRLSILQKQSILERLTSVSHEILHAFEDEYEFEIPHHLVYKLDRAIALFILMNFWDD